MLELEEQGWLWNRFIGRGKHRAPTNYMAGSARIWYSTKVVSHRYHQCLQEDVYKRLLEEGFSALSNPSVLMDVEEHEIHDDNVEACLAN